MQFTKQLTLPLNLAIKIEFNDKVITFDEVMKGLDLRKYLIEHKTQKGYDIVKMFKRKKQSHDKI